MTIRRIDPDEAVVINGFPVTAWQLAEARQELSHRGVHNPRWSELDERDQETAALSAGAWLRALAELVAPPGPADGEPVCVDGLCGRTADGPHRPHPLAPLIDENHWNGFECPARPCCTVAAHHSIDGGDTSSNPGGER